MREKIRWFMSSYWRVAAAMGGFYFACMTALFPFRDLGSISTVFLGLSFLLVGSAFYGLVAAALLWPVQQFVARRRQSRAG